MAKFSEFDLQPDVVVGKHIDIDDLFDRRILIEKTIIKDTKYPGKNSSGLRMQMQVVLASFSDSPDAQGDCFAKDGEGMAVGERRSCFTGSDNLISSIQQAEQRLQVLNAAREKRGLPVLVSVYPIDTTIVKVGKCFKFV